VSALKAVSALADKCMPRAEAQLCAQLSPLLIAASNKQIKIRVAAEEAVIAITSKISPNAVCNVLPALFEAGEVGQGWQTRALSLKIISNFSDYAPEQLGFALPEVGVFVCVCVCV
jgi:hypothetical protein